MESGGPSAKEILYFLARNWNVWPEVWFFDTAKQGTQAVSI